MRNQLVVFENPGVIDVRSMRMFGVSVKEGTNPIGYFGTGLKYAIAILLRHGQGITIDAGGETFVFTLKTIDIRDKSFDVVMMNDTEMPFTTELGKNWDLWQAFREIYCNCIDENGSVKLIDRDELLESNYQELGDRTRVIISGAESVITYHERDSIVLRMPSELRVGSGAVEIFNKPSDWIYYRGIRVFKSQYPSMLTYNIIDQSTLTEDRTLHNTALGLNKISLAITTLTDKKVIKAVITNRKCLEALMDFSSVSLWGHTHSTEFEEVVSGEFDKNNDHLNGTIRVWYKNKLNRQSMKSYEPVRMSEVEQAQMEKVIRICKRTFRDFVEYDYLIVRTLGDQTMALAEIDQERMIFSKRCFELGTKFLLSTYIEEYSHIKTKHNDLTRELQTYLFDSLCTLIEDHVIKEPV